MRTLLLGLLVVCPLRADDTLAKSVDRAVAKEMAAQELVGVAVGVIRDGKIAYLQGYGVADLGTRSPVTPKTVFNWASNSKPLAAVLAMQLKSSGALDLDADVRKYVPEFPDKGETITVRHLLCHQSGIPHYLNGKVVPTKKTYSDAEPYSNPVNGLDKFNQSPLLFKPAEKTSYSSYAYLLLSAAIQGAAKKPFTEVVAARVSSPLKLSSFQWDGEKTQPDWATGYLRTAGKIVRAPDEAHDWKHGAGGFKSDVKDFARWAQALMNRELMDEATETLMWTPQKHRDGSASEYGLGVRIRSSPKLVVSHGGSQSETKTHMFLLPREKTGVVVMSNCNFADPAKITTAVLAALSTP